MNLCCAEAMHAFGGIDGYLLRRIEARSSWGLLVPLLLVPSLSRLDLAREPYPVSQESHSIRVSIMLKPKKPMESN